MADSKFPNGFRVYKPSDKAPQFVKANILIHVQDFQNWMHNHAAADGTLRLSILLNKDGNGYHAEKDEYRKPSGYQDRPAPSTAEEQVVADGLDADEIPF